MSQSIRQQLGRLKTRGEKIIDSFDDLTPKWNDRNIIVLEAISTQATTQLQRIQDKYDEWEALISDIQGTDQIDEQDLYEKWKANDDYVDLMEDLQNIVETSTRLSSTPASSIAPLVPAKIAAQDIQKFNGEYMKWQPFWQRFLLNIDSKEYPSIQKLDALLGLLEGKAYDEVQGFAVIEANYVTVKQILVDRFGNNDRILYELQNQLYMIPPARPNVSSLRETVTSINNLCRQIQNLGIDINTPTLKWDIIHKMPVAERTELTIAAQTQPNTTTEDVLKLMKEYELKAEIRAKIQRESSSSFSIAPTPRSPSKRWVCSFCNGDHASGLCQKFKTPDERITQLKSQRCCLKCAGRNHTTNECHSTVKCQNCYGNHQSFLCNKQKNANSNKTQTFIAVDRDECPLLAKEITVMNPETKTEAKAVVFLDSGSQRNYISNNLFHKLKLKSIADECVNLEGIGGKKGQHNSKLVELRIPTVDGSFLDITANTIPKIATTVPMVETGDPDPLQSSIVRKEPDILVGMEDFFYIIKAAKEENGIFILDTKIGPMISGKLAGGQQQTTVTCTALASSFAAGEGLVKFKNVALGDWWELHKQKYGMARLGKYQFELG